jgi:hypothetical protein
MEKQTRNLSKKRLQAAADAQAESERLQREEWEREEAVNSRPICTSHSRLDMYHQKECGGGQDSGFNGASEVEIFETNSFLRWVGGSDRRGAWM